MSHYKLASCSIVDISSAFVELHFLREDIRKKTISEKIEELAIEIGLRWMTEKEVISGKASFFFCPLFY
ncbi:hypothetical protein ACS0TY_009404 [Phlomoides rotata]